jgi:inorganic triphosphatase YgiF
MVKSEQRERETETALLICAEDPASLARRIARIVKVAGYQLLRRPPVRLRDLYFDTPDGALRKQQLAVRLRESDRVKLITLKGPAQRAIGGGLQRLEIEARWSRAALRRVVRELVDRSVIVQPRRLEADARPLTVMNSLGFEIVQGRETNRTVRDVVLAGRKGPRLAELAVDSVVYRFGDEEIRLHMVEVEAKRQDGLPALAVVTQDLRERFKPMLREWTFGKLATGMAVEQLLLLAWEE